MTVGELIAQLSRYPSDSNVYLEDLDTEWLFTKLNVTLGHTARNNYPEKCGAVFLWVDSYADREEDE